MKVKGIISEERVTLPEVRGVLSGVESERIAAEKEMSYEFRRSIEHANKLAKTAPEKSHALVAELVKMEKMKPEIAYRIANIMPKTRDKCGRSLQKSGTRCLLKNSIKLSNT